MQMYHILILLFLLAVAVKPSSPTNGTVVRRMMTIKVTVIKGYRRIFLVTSVDGVKVPIVQGNCLLFVVCVVGQRIAIVERFRLIRVVQILTL